MRKLFFLPLFLLLFCGCLPTQNIDIEFPFEERMTVYGFWALGRPHELFVSNSIGVNETGELVALDSATVLLYADGEQVDSLRFEQDRYVSSNNYTLTHGTLYEITVSHPAYPQARALVTLPAPLNVPLELVSIVADTLDQLTLLPEPWLNDASFNLGYYRIQLDGEFVNIDEPLDSLFPNFLLRDAFGINADRTATFSVNKTWEQFPPSFPEFRIVDLAGIELVAYRYSPDILAFFDYSDRVNVPFGSSELQLVDLERPGNIEGGYGLFSYYEEARQRINF